jgi:hypothetical protein
MIIESFEYRLEQALNTIIESEERFKARVKKAALGQGKTNRQGLFGIVDEFDVDLDTAHQYFEVLGGGYYGEDDIDDKVLHRARAPQAIYKLLKYFGVPSAISKKLIRFHIDNFKTISRHVTSPGDKIVIPQMYKRERLAGMVTLPLEQLRKMGFVVKPTSWADDLEFEEFGDGIWYIAWPGDEDIIEEMSKTANTDVKLDLLHGLAFGYPMVDVFNFVRKQDKQLVDSIVGNTNDLSKN